MPISTLSGFELCPRWVPLTKRQTQDSGVRVTKLKKRFEST